MSVRQANPKSWLIRSCLAASLIAIAACGGLDSAPPVDNLAANEIYELAERQLSDGQADDAAITFGEIERLYPYSALAERALIMQAFAFHRDEDYPSSRAAAQRYLDFYPAEEDAPYAAYLVALSYYDQIDEIGRDQGLTVQALRSLQRVIEVYPGSEYASLSTQKFDLAFDHLAAKEMEVGRFYL
ncbi:MAG: outer membrane protein assembly factor BamD, partial [Henriciella sp.]|uniref:outer membrane protein assembly factor BamD n=1 Tax=Henriciella sp. TaxID=1968823 RepID=UPI003C792880